MDIFILIILAIAPGVWSRDWNVALENQCALRGSSLVLKCEYDYPYGHKVESVSWLKYQWVERRLVPVSDLPAPLGHFIYVGNYYGNCNLKINDVQRTDQGHYYFSFVTTRNRWRSKNSAFIFVRELTASLEPSTVLEGESVRLACKSACPDSPATVWFRDGQPVQKTELELEFQVSREDAGSYHCAVPGQEPIRSNSVTLNVQYAPKNVTLSLPEKVIAGSSVTISCSSEANPAVTPEGYDLYKDGELIVSGQNVTITDVRPSHSGLYHCTARNNITWTDDDVRNSTEVYLDVQYGPTATSVSMTRNETSEGGSVNMTCSSDANPEADNYTWYRQPEANSSGSMLWVGSGKVLTLQLVEASDEGLYVCQARNSLGERNSSGVLLTVKKERHGFQFQPVMIGLAGLAALVAVMTLLLLIWKKKSKVKAEEKTSVEDDQIDNVYANPMETCPPSPSAHTALGVQQEALQIYQTPSSDEDDVTYTTVTFQPRNPDHTNNDMDSCPKAAEEEESVIYATVVKSS